MIISSKQNNFIGLYGQIGLKACDACLWKSSKLKSSEIWEFRGLTNMHCVSNRKSFEWKLLHLNNTIMPEAHAEPSQTHKMELFEKIVNSFQLLTVFSKSFISDAWLGSEYAFECRFQSFKSICKSLNPSTLIITKAKHWD